MVHNYHPLYTKDKSEIMGLSSGCFPVWAEVPRLQTPRLQILKWTECKLFVESLFFFFFSSSMSEVRYLWQVVKVFCSCFVILLPLPLYTHMFTIMLDIAVLCFSLYNLFPGHFQMSWSGLLSSPENTGVLASLSTSSKWQQCGGVCSCVCA